MVEIPDEIKNKVTTPEEFDAILAGNDNKWPAEESVTAPLIWKKVHDTVDAKAWEAVIEDSRDCTGEIRFSAIIRSDDSWSWSCSVVVRPPDPVWEPFKARGGSCSSPEMAIIGMYANMVWLKEIGI